jgi:CHAD domain-containing protein
MPPKPDESLCVFGAIALQRFQDALRQEIEGVRLGKDIECIHRMRVASRRMRAALDLFKACLPPKRFPFWEKEFRRVTRALGAARDLDVQIERLTEFGAKTAGSREQPGLRRLKLRLRQRRAALQDDVISALDHLENDGVLGDVQFRLTPLLQKQTQTYLFSPAIYARAHEAITDRLDGFLAYEEFISQPERVEELHMLRINAKRLRYTMEIFATLYPGELKEPLQACRKAQDQLGDIHDCDVWIELLPGFLAEERARTQDYFGNLNGYFRLVPGIECFLADRQQARASTYENFYSFWQKQQAQGTWQKLREQIQIPYFRGEPPPATEPGLASTETGEK